jgi:hypothetical protein
MKKSNFDRLIMRFVIRKTSASQTAKIERMLKAAKSRKIHFISAETEECLYRKITDRRVSAEQVAPYGERLFKLTVPGINWLRIKPFCVYFHKDCIRGV